MVADPISPCCWPYPGRRVEHLGLLHGSFVPQNFVVVERAADDAADEPCEEGDLHQALGAGSRVPHKFRDHAVLLVQSTPRKAEADPKATRINLDIGACFFASSGTTSERLEKNRQPQRTQRAQRGADPSGRAPPAAASGDAGSHPGVSRPRPPKGAAATPRDGAHAQVHPDPKPRLQLSPSIPLIPVKKSNLKQG